MLTAFVVWAYVLTVINFTAASFKFNSKDTAKDSQYVLKSLAEFHHQGHLYKPLRFYTKVIEESFNDDEENKSLQSVLATSTKIISDLLLASSSSDKIRLSENNQCSDILLGQMIPTEDLEVDIAIFAVNNEEKREIATSKKCEVSENNTVKFMALEINAEKFMELDEISQVKEFCIAITSALYEENEGEKQILIGEIEEILEKEREIKIAPILGACIAGQNNCAYCDITNTNCEVCNTRYFLRGGVCVVCQAPCAECRGTETFCTSCEDASHMTLNSGTCSCNFLYASFKLETLSCQCNAGYFETSNSCKACDTNCATCSGSAKNCITCSDTTHMSAAPECACPTNSVFQGTTCVSSTGYFLNSNNLFTACSSNCAACSTSASQCMICSDTTHMSAAPTCACPTNSCLQGTTCVCNTGYYFSTNTVCSACNTNCGTCSAAATCTTCSDTTHMSAAPACACPTNGLLQGTTCVCNTGYYFSANTVCSACISPCATCSAASMCLTCSDTTHMSAAPTCACPINGHLQGTTCVCYNGYFFSSNTVCTACNAACATCTTSATNCVTCVDTTHMSAAPACACPINASLSGTTCVCNTGYYFSANTVCSACDTNCATCTTSYWNCLTCIDSTHMSVAPPCACPANGALSGTTCVCNAGYYFSANTVCSACSVNCNSCSGSASMCITCSDTIHMSAAPTCACPINGHLQGTTCVCYNGYFFSSNTVCTACSPQCATCTTSATTCITCSDTIHMLAAPTCACPTNGVSSGTTCVCNTGYYFSKNTVCSACSANCATCTTSSLNCLTCIDSTHMSAAPTCTCPYNGSLQGTSCVCNIGYYFCASTVCCACNTNCAACSGSSAACITCSDTTHMSAAPTCACPTNGSLQGTTCACNFGYYFSANTVCSACSTECATCSVTATNCLTCSDTTHMSAAPTCACPTNGALSGTTCVCNTGYYFSANTVCSACNINCATCTTSYGNCLTCIDSTHMSAAPACVCPSNSIFAGLSCECNSGYYFSSNTVCSACTFPCSECSTSATICTACEDGYYLNGNTCSPDQCQCEAPCATCSTSPTTCTSCDDPNNMTLFGGTCTCNDANAAFSTISNTCVCNEGFFNNNGVCIQCNSPCLTCSSATACQSCIDGYWLNGEICQTCTLPCTKCSNSGTQCTACVNGTTLNSTSGTCSCLDPNSSFNNSTLTCKCNSGYYENGGACMCADNNAFFNQTSKSCQCNQGYYMSSTGICQLCQAPCAQCLNSPAFCVVCDDFANMNLNTTTGVCTCKDPNALFNPWLKACQVNPGCNCNQCAPIIINYGTIINL